MPPLIADLHTHSKYSRACSKTLELPVMEAWAKFKGIDIVSCADFTHPKWFAEISEQLEEADEGLFRVKKKFRSNLQIPKTCEREVRFILGAEISLIYKKGERVRKIHHLILAPNLKTVAKINIELGKRGNIRSDGRPILGLDSKILLGILLSISPDIELIPAHAWTPHFSIFGSKSGFDSVEECFEELSPNIHALETGLSSDPAMNWRLSKNDRYVLVSNSDAHSPRKFGREATLFDAEKNYPSLLHALRNDHEKIAGTLEFFPEEGKYHADGLRDENLWMMPEQTKRIGGISPRTKRPLTIGVLHRVTDLADRPLGFSPKTARPFWNIIPLAELVAEIVGTKPGSKKADEMYWQCLRVLGPEFFILKDCPVEKIRQVNGALAVAIQRMREKKVIVQPGFDGQYGVIKVFEEGELKKTLQSCLF